MTKFFFLLFSISVIPPEISETLQWHVLFGSNPQIIRKTSSISYCSSMMSTKRARFISKSSTIKILCFTIRLRQWFYYNYNIYILATLILVRYANRLTPFDTDKIGLPRYNLDREETSYEATRNKIYICI